jgi:hypothetical protein
MVALRWINTIGCTAPSRGARGKRGGFEMRRNTLPPYGLWRRFWLAVLRFAFRRINDPIRYMPVGIPAIRDPDNRCGGYDPLPRSSVPDHPMLGWGDCQTDGHYLCEDCCHADRGAIRDRAGGV